MVDGFGSEAAEPISERDQEILRRRASGDDLREIGHDYGISHEAVRLVVKKHGGVSGAEARAARKRRDVAERDQRVTAFVDELGPSIRAAAANGTTRGETEEIVRLLRPELPTSVVSEGIDAAGAVFDLAITDLHYSEQAIAAAAWFVAGNLADVPGTTPKALPFVDVGEAQELEAILARLGLDPGATATVIETIALTRASASEGPVALASGAYDRARTAFLQAHGLSSSKGTVVWPPTSATISKRFGGKSWSDAMDAIGLTAGTAHDRLGLPSISEQEYIGAVTEYLDEAERLGVRPTYRGYDTWSDAEDRAGRRRPSAHSVRREFGTWTRAQRAASSQAPTRPLVRPAGGPVVSRSALVNAEAALQECPERIGSGSRREAAAHATTFLRAEHGEFEVRHRSWLRAVVLADSSVLPARLAEPRGKIPNAQYKMGPGTAQVDGVLTDRYLDSLLADGDPTFADGWLRLDLQREVDRLPTRDRLAFNAGRALRNLFTHHSNEAQNRATQALDALAAQDGTFALRQAPTVRILGDWLISSEARRLQILGESIPAFWRLAMVVEALAAPTDPGS